MTPGKWYVTGEKGMELIGPKNAGLTVHPLGHGGGKPSIVNNNYFQGFKNTDMFKRSGSQIAQMLHRQTSIALSRG